jgi:hypothetical protein
VRAEYHFQQMCRLQTKPILKRAPKTQLGQRLQCEEEGDTLDDRGFDALTRTLATGRSRRSILRGLIGGSAALVAAKTGSALAAPAPKVDVCHWHEETGTYSVINISTNGWTNGHSGHEHDYLRTDCCIDSDCPESDACTTHTCDTGTCGTVSHAVDCVVSEWSDWSACSNTCGFGTSTRTRTITSESSCGGTECPPLEESADCTGVTCSPNIGVAFGPTGSENFCMVYVELDQFAPETNYAGTYDLAGFGNRGAIGPTFDTNENGDAGPIGVFSFVRNRSINFNIGGVSSGYYAITC